MINCPFCRKELNKKQIYNTEIKEYICGDEYHYIQYTGENISKIYFILSDINSEIEHYFNNNFNYEAIKNYSCIVLSSNLPLIKTNHNLDLNNINLLKEFAIKILDNLLFL